MSKLPLPLFAAALAAAWPAAAQEPTMPVVVIVRVPKPWYAPRALVAGKMRDSIPQYARLPGLLFKAFSFERDSGEYGGIYLWRSRAEARSWFSNAWFERVRQERGAEAQVRYLDAPLTIDNSPGGTAADSDSRSVVTVVDVAVPAGLTRARILALFGEAAPEYQKAAGLMRKHFTIADGDASFGGVYLWRDEAAARAWFNEAWHARVLQQTGSPARIQWFDTPILLPTQDPDNQAPAGAMIVAAP